MDHVIDLIKTSKQKNENDVTLRAFEFINSHYFVFRHHTSFDIFMTFKWTHIFLVYFNWRRNIRRVYFFFQSLPRSPN